MHRLNITHRYLLPMLSLLLLNACMMGPDFHKPEAPQMQAWSSQEPIKASADVDAKAWWLAFHDPALNALIDKAYQQNPNLQLAGLRVLEARAQLGLTEGSLYPQHQQASGSVMRHGISKQAANFLPGMSSSFSTYQLGLDAAWEIDFWGRFRRAVESSEAGFQASVADYDDALLVLTAEVARVYINIRTLEARLLLAKENIKLQEESLRIASVRFEHGATTELDLQQAKSNLAGTKATVPSLYSLLRQSKNALSVLLGETPNALHLPPRSGLIDVPESVIVGMPADLLRRRPDVRRAEFLAAQQSALIGVAETDLYPHFSLFGSIGLQTSSLTGGGLFKASNLTYGLGPSFSWKLLNYGRVKANIQIQDARYQQTLVHYHDTVLRAYQEVENAMIAFTQTHEEVKYRRESAEAAKRAAALARIQYREGSVDFQRVISSEQRLVLQEDQWLLKRGEIALHFIALYKAMGGAWKFADGKPLISEANRQAMDARSDWGSLLKVQEH